MLLISVKLLITLTAIYIAYKVLDALRSGIISSGPQRDGIVVDKRKNPLTFLIVLGIHIFAIFACIWWVVLK